MSYRESIPDGTFSSGWPGDLARSWLGSFCRFGVAKCARQEKKAKNSEINSPLPLLAARPGRWRKSKKQKSLFIYLFSYKIGRFDCIYFARTFFFPKPHHFGTLDPGPPDGVRVSRGFYEDRPGLEGMEKAFALISAYGPTGSKKCGFIECIIIWKWCWSVRKFQLPLERFPWAT